MLENLYERYEKKRVYMWIAILIIIFHIMTLFIIYKMNQFTIDGQKFKYISAWVLFLSTIHKYHDLIIHNLNKWLK